MNSQGYAVGTHLSLNSGCMSHGNIGSKTGGLSKALIMTVCLLVCPLNLDKDMDFSKAWYACDVSNLPRFGLEILWFLNRAVSRHFWVSRVRVRVFLGQGQSLLPSFELEIISSFRLSLLLIAPNDWLHNGPELGHTCPLTHFI